MKTYPHLLAMPLAKLAIKLRGKIYEKDKLRITDTLEKSGSAECLELSKQLLGDIVHGKN